MSHGACSDLINVAASRAAKGEQSWRIAPARSPKIEAGPAKFCGELLE